MMTDKTTIFDLLTLLRQQGVELWLEGEQLRFRAPKGALTDNLRGRLVERKPELIAFLRQAETLSPANMSRQTITAVSRAESLPLSFAQQRLWFLNRLDPDSRAYHIPAAVRIEGALDVALLEETINYLVQRHELLRTTFRHNSVNPEQQIHAGWRFAFTPDVAPDNFANTTNPILDLSHAAGSEQEVTALRLMQEDEKRPFSLTTGPLFRLILFKLAHNDHILYLNMHHIISDGWSIGVMISELLHVYETLAQRSQPKLPLLPIQYADYAAWQRGWLQGDTLAQQIDFWRKHLEGYPQILDLPSDYARPSSQSYRGGRWNFELPAALTTRLLAASQAEDCTPFMLMLAAFDVLLHRYTAQTKFLVGTPTAGREQTAVSPLIGLFMNTLIMRAAVDPAQTFRNFLQQIKRDSLEAFAHQAMPFEKLVEVLKPDRDLSRSPLFQVLFSFHNEPLPPLAMPGFSLTLIDLPRATTAFDLSLDLRERQGRLVGSIEYSADLFAPETISRLAGHYAQILTAVAANPDIPVGNIPLLTEIEQAELLRQWNQPVTAVSPQPVHKLIEAQTAVSPHHIALENETGDRRCTYGQLNGQANQLARHLQTTGVQPGTRVAVCLSRSPHMVMALLAVLKAGGVYIPLDPAYPADRLRHILEDAGAPLLITESHLLPSLPPTTAHILPLDVHWEAITGLSVDPLPVNVAPTDLAYIIYTSGSTGKPKGVQISHQALTNFLVSMQQEPGISAEDTLLAVTTLSFDIAGLELFLPLICGARVVIATEAVVNDGQQLQQALRRTGATLMQATPATWRLLLAAGWQGQPGLKMLCGGEALPRELAQALLTCGGSLWNMYGPTETTIWSAVYRVRPEEGPVPIGHPIANTRFYVLDGQQQPTPTGVPGELYIGGQGVAAGYVNLPALTAERFVWLDPAKWIGGGGHAAQRCYRTGDLVRRRGDGALIFIGRLDNQVKVRGFRIELGEIEAVLSQHEQVGQCVVAVQEAADGDKRLVAYVCPDGEAPTISALRRFLAERLPAYMVVTDLVILAQFPLTPNGKIDRKALPAPSTEVRPSLAADFVPPRNETECKLAAIWQSVLGVKQVGVYDSFFDLGGHSLLATALLFRVEREFGMDIPVLTFFRAPHIAQMASVLAAKKAGVEISIDGEGAPFSLQDEVSLAVELSQVRDVPLAQVIAPKHLFLTGVTGFVGAFLLDELLNRTNAEIHCLVRAENEAEGLLRIQETLMQYQIDRPDMTDRVHLIAGDLTRSNFGLPAEQYEMLCQQIDVIYHCAANTNFIYPYRELKAVNVNGVNEIIKLAAAHHTKPLHHISTLYVFAEPDLALDDFIPEQAMPAHPDALPIGYAQSKWVVEHMLHLARAQNLPVAIYRLGRVSGQSKSGACRSDDFAWQFIKACVETKIAPDLDRLVDMTPVDYVSRAVVHLAQQPASLGQNYHLINKHPPTLPQIVQWASAFGYEITVQPYTSWRMQLLQYATQHVNSAAYALAPFLPEAAADLQTGAVHYGTEQTERGLHGANIFCPGIDEAVFHSYLSYFKERNFLPLPYK